MSLKVREKGKPRRARLQKLNHKGSRRSVLHVDAKSCGLIFTFLELDRIELRLYPRQTHEHIAGDSGTGAPEALRQSRGRQGHRFPGRSRRGLWAAGAEWRRQD